MRFLAMLCMVVGACCVLGCQAREEARVTHAPLVTGTLESGTFWKNPLSAPSNEGGSYAKGSRIDVYEQFVIVTTPQGLSHLHPHGYYSELSIKRN